MKCQTDILLNIVACLLCVKFVLTEPQFATNNHPKPLIFKTWPPSRNAASIRANGFMLQLRGAGSSNIATRLPSPGMFIKSGTPIRFAVPMRMTDRPIKGSLVPSPSNHVYFKAGSPHAQSLTRPYAAHLSASGMFKFSSPHKTAIKLQAAPPVPLKNKPNYIYEKVNVPKYPDVKYSIGSDGAIHTIPAPDLGSFKDTTPIPDINPNNLNSLNSQFDSDLLQFSPNAFALQKPHHSHSYQVNEQLNDITFKNTQTGQQSYFAPDNDPSLKTKGLRPIDDPLSVPSDGKSKPADVLYHQSLDFSASPLVQSQQFSYDPFGFPGATQPQLQQYHLQQNNMMKQGMPLASLNPTYLIMQSNSLFGQHQQHLTNQNQHFRPENGYIDTSNTAQPTHITYNPYDYTAPEQPASIGQIYSAQQDQLHHDFFSSTQTPTTLASSSFHHDGAASHENPAFAQVLEPKPSNYQYSHQNFIDLPDEHLTQNDIQNLLSYNDLYQDYVNHRQTENDLILKEAQEKLQHKINAQHQQEQTAFDLHQLVQQEKYHPLRIVVPDDDEHGFKKRVDDEADSYEDFEEDDDASVSEDTKS